MTALMLSVDAAPHSIRDRQRAVAELAQAGMATPAQIAKALAARGIVNPHTGRRYSSGTIRADLRAVERTGVREIIGRNATILSAWKRYPSTKLTPDDTQGNYAFWDKLRRGQVEGFKLGALFCLPLTQIVASFVFGEGIGAELSKTVEASEDRIAYTNSLLARFLSAHHGLLLNTAVDLYGLGDQYIAVNPDGSLTVISPEQVEIRTNPLDYRTVDAYTVETRLREARLVDTFTKDRRSLLVERGGQSVTYDFENLIGRFPLVHWANDRAANEIYGRPVYEALYDLFSRYDDLINKALDGAELMGNPMPTLVGVENIDETIDANATIDDMDYIDRDGNAETRRTIRFDTLAFMVVGKGGDFKYASPPTGFTTDIRNMLQSLFYLMLDYTRVPEGVWGAAVASSRASLDAQMPPFWMYLQGRRIAFEGQGADPELGLEARGGLYELLDIWLRTRALTDPRVVVGPVTLRWPAFSEENAETLLKWISYLDGRGYVTRKTVLAASGHVEDPAAELEAADKEGAELRAAEQEYQDALQAAIQTANGEAARGTEPGEGADVHPERMEA